MNKYLKSVLVIFSVCCLYATGSCQNSSSLKVVIIRHGEKPEQGNNLSCQGLNRALQLPKVLNAKFGTPSAIFVPSVGVGKKTKYARMFETITPFAIKYNLTINSNYEEEDYKSIAKDVKSRTGTVIMVWEHNAIPGLVNALGVKQDIDWPASDFDSIWILTYKNGTATLSKDKEGLSPAAGCAF